MKTALPKEASRVIVVQNHLLQDQQEQSEQRTSPLRVVLYAEECCYSGEDR